MGQLVSRIYGKALREANMYNIEQRAQKVISKDKPTRAPMHPSAVQELERMKEDNVSTDYLHKKDQTLDEYLKKVYVSTPYPEHPRLESPARPLPRDRHQRGEMSYGYYEAEEEKVPEGKVSLKQALAIITAHQTDPEMHNTASISQQYKIDPKITSDILEHFKMFNVHVKKKGVDSDSLTEAQKLTMRVQAMTMLNADEVAKELNLGSKLESYKAKFARSMGKTVESTTELNKEDISSKNGSKDNR